MLDLLDRVLPPSDQVLAEDIGRDNRLAHAQSLAAQDQLLPAAEAAKKIWEADIYDVRAIGYLLCGAFLEEGLPALPRAWRCLHRCLRENWDQLKPQAQKAKHLGSALRWLFMTLYNQLAFCKFENNKVWQECVTNGPLVAETVAELNVMSSMVAERPEIPMFAAQVQKVMDLLLPHALAAPPPAALPRPPAPTSPSYSPVTFGKEAAPPEVPAESFAAPPVVAPAVQNPAKEPDFVLILDQSLLNPGPAPEVSPAPQPQPPQQSQPEAPPRTLAIVEPEHFSLPLHATLRWLIYQLQAAVEMLRQRDFLRAGVIIADIEQSLDQMEPEMLLDGALSDFWAALSVHADALIPALAWAASDNRRARLWQRLYGLFPAGFAAEPNPGEPSNGLFELATRTTLDLPSTKAAPLPQLLAALRSASTLLARGVMERAAVVVADLLPRLLHFDTRQYLAPLLLAYYRAQADCASELEQAGTQLGSLRVQALRRLYEMDPAAFLADSCPVAGRSPAPPELTAILDARIEAFSDLLSRGDPLRASVLAAEIESLAERAGALVPPANLRRFYALLLKSSSALEKMQPLLQTLKGKALRGLCRADLSQFLTIPI